MKRQPRLDIREPDELFTYETRDDETKELKGYVKVFCARKVDNDKIMRRDHFDSRGRFISTSEVRVAREESSNTPSIGKWKI